MKFKSLSVPLLICGDNPALTGGLSRSGRDIATLACTLPQCRVGYLGRGIGNRRKLPFTVYDYPESGGWGQDYIAQAWNDFSGGDYGIIFSTDDLSRRHWFTNPVGMSGDLATFLGEGRTFQKWAYVPLDSVGPNGRSLPLAQTDCMLRFDRVLTTSEWGQNVIITSGRRDVDWLPHGIHPDKFFYPGEEHCSGSVTAKESVGWEDSDVWLGCVMANQSRKDYPAAFECFAELKREYGSRFHAWLHTDAMIQYWNVYALAADYGVGDCIEVTLGLTDSELAIRYSACDCTILPSAGEGFGFPIAESMACGTACVVTDYAAGQEIVPEDCRVKPMCYRVDTIHNVLRAVLSGYGFAVKAKEQIELKRGDWQYQSERIADSVKHLQWPSLKHLWSRWLVEGLR